MSINLSDGQLGHVIPIHETLSLSELLDEIWRILLGGVRGILLLLAYILHIVARIAFTIMLKVLLGLTWARTFVEQWQPVTPHVFEIRRHR